MLVINKLILNSKRSLLLSFLLVIIMILHTTVSSEARHSKFEAEVIDTKGKSKVLPNIRFGKRLPTTAFGDFSWDDYIPIKYKGGFLRIPFSNIQAVERIKFIPRPKNRGGFSVDEDSIQAKVILHDGRTFIGNIQDVPGNTTAMAVGGGQNLNVDWVSITTLQSLVTKIVSKRNIISSSSEENCLSAILTTITGNEVVVCNPNSFWLSNENGTPILSFFNAEQNRQAEIPISKINTIKVSHNEYKVSSFEYNIDHNLEIRTKDGERYEGKINSASSFGGNIDVGVFIAPFPNLNYITIK